LIVGQQNANFSVHHATLTLTLFLEDEGIFIVHCSLVIVLSFLPDSALHINCAPIIAARSYALQAEPLSSATCVSSKPRRHHESSTATGRCGAPGHFHTTGISVPFNVECFFGNESCPATSFEMAACGSPISVRPHAGPIAEVQCCSFQCARQAGSSTGLTT
jgi:hypothetical protein